MAEIDPYTPPAHDPQTNQYRATTAHRIVLRLLMLGRVRPARFNPATSEHCMYQAWWVVGTGWVFVALAIPGSVAVLMTDALVMAVIILVSSLGVGLVIIAAAERVCWTDRYLRREGPFFRRQRFAWDEISGVALLSNGDLSIVAGKKQIVVCNDLHGQMELIEQLRQKLPPDVLAGADLELRELARMYD